MHPRGWFRVLIGEQRCLLNHTGRWKISESGLIFVLEASSDIISKQ